VQLAALAKPMDERNWELYRLSVIDTMTDGPLKQALLNAVHNKLSILTQQDIARGLDQGLNSANFGIAAGATFL